MRGSAHAGPTADGSPTHDHVSPHGDSATTNGYSPAAHRNGDDSADSDRVANYHEHAGNRDVSRLHGRFWNAMQFA